MRRKKKREPSIDRELSLVRLLLLSTSTSTSKPRERENPKKKPTTLNNNNNRFALDHPTQLLGLPTGHHITLKCTVPATGEEAMRPYTPVTDDATRGTVDFVIKVYPTGRVTPALDSLKIGDMVLAKGPKGRFTYKPNLADDVGLVAGGTGITPMFAVAMAALRDSSVDKTRFSLIFANVTEEDILIRDRLEDLARENPGRFRVHHVLNEPPKKKKKTEKGEEEEEDKPWEGSTGFVTREILERHLPAPGPRTLVLRCGPGPMNKAVGAALEELGYSKEMTFEF